jgi:hypothetical protein
VSQHRPIDFLEYVTSHVNPRLWIDPHGVRVERRVVDLTKGPLP